MPSSRRYSKLSRGCFRPADMLPSGKPDPVYARAKERAGFSTQRPPHALGDRRLSEGPVLTERAYSSAGSFAFFASRRLRASSSRMRCRSRPRLISIAYFADHHIVARGGPDSDFSSHRARVRARLNR